MSVIDMEVNSTYHSCDRFEPLIICIPKLNNRVFYVWTRLWRCVSSSCFEQVLSPMSLQQKSWLL